MKQLILTVTSAILFCATLPAQDLTDPQNLPKELAAARTRLEKTEDTEENKDWRSAIAERIALIESHASTQASSKRIDAQTIKEDLAAAEINLEQAKKRPEPTAPILSEAESLSTALQELEDVFTKMKTAAEAVKSKLNTSKEQITQARGEREVSGTQLTTANNKLEQLTETDPITVYRRTNNLFARNHYKEKKVYLDKAIRHLTDLLPLLEVEIQIAQLDQTRAMARLTLAREAATVIREQRAEDARQKSQDQKRKAELEADPIERFIRQKSATISTLQAETAELLIEVETKKASLSEEQEETKRVTGQLQSFRQRLSAGGRTSTDSFLSRTLDRTRRSHDRLIAFSVPATDADIERVQDQLAEALDLEFTLELPLDDNPLFQALLEVTPEGERARAEQRFAELRDGNEATNSPGLLKSHRDKLRIVEELADQLNQIILKQRDHLEKLEELDQYLRGQMFWIQSDPPMNWSTIVRAGKQVPQIVVPFSQSPDWPTIRAALLARPLVLLAAILLIGLAFIPGVRRSKKSRTKAADAPTHSVEQRIYEVLRAAILPIGLALCARILDQSRLGQPIALGLVALLDTASILIAIRCASITLLCPTGILIHYKVFFPDVATQLLRALKFFTAISLLTWPLHSLLETEGFHLDALERILETTWLISTVLVTIYLIRVRGSLVQKWTRADGLTRRVWTFISPILSLQLIATVALFILGFTIGARQLSGNATKTLVAVIILASLYRLSIRIAAKSTAYMRSKMLAQGEGEAWSEASASTFQFMTRSAAVMIFLIAAVILQQLWGIGANVRNVLGGLNALEIGIEGDKDYLLLTYLDIFYATLWIVGGHVIAHNVGRVYELVFVPLIGQGHRGGRYALITLSRYGILLGAWVAALLALHVSFEKLSWLLTATSVGIGFGLQEIVANFISGLILLFERPIRVGDIVTVGTTEGTVDKITIRATVVTNWERQTIIVPNKTFITENLTNWTRNDQVMRRTLKLGVAHGSDVEKVLRVLSEVVADHSCVLKEPPHRIWFRGIGEFTLNFEVWIFTAIDDGLRTRSELYGMIYRKLEKEGIKIPLPQTETRLIGNPGPLS